jgi:hypothetical protein
MMIIFLHETPSLLSTETSRVTQTRILSRLAEASPTQNKIEMLDDVSARQNCQRQSPIEGIRVHDVSRELILNEGIGQRVPSQLVIEKYIYMYIYMHTE